MNHLTIMAELRKQLPPLYSMDGRGDDAKIYRIRLYKQIGVLPQEVFEWFLSEYDPNENEAFGFASLYDPHNAELGYVSIGELFGVGVNIDMEFQPLSLSEIKRRIGA